MKNQSCHEEIPLKKKLDFLKHAIKKFEKWNSYHPDDVRWDWDGICIVFKNWANIRIWRNLKYMFPELWKEIERALVRTESRNVIEWENNSYACLGRLKLLQRVQKQISK